MPQLRPAGRGVAFHGAADRPAELNFNYRVLSIENGTVMREKITFLVLEFSIRESQLAEFLERFSLVELRS